MRAYPYYPYAPPIYRGACKGKGKCEGTLTRTNASAPPKSTQNVTPAIRNIFSQATK